MTSSLLSRSTLLIGLAATLSVLWSVSAIAEERSPIYIFGLGTLDPSKVTATPAAQPGKEAQVGAAANSRRGTFGGELGVGYRFSPNVATELSINAGLPQSGRFGANGDFRTHMMGVRAGVLGIVPLSSNFEVFTKASIGYEFTRTRLNYAGAVANQRKGRIVPAIGVGVTYYVTPNLAFRAEYEYQVKVGRKARADENIAVSSGDASDVTLRRQNLGMVKIGLQYSF
ncbi:outer membrane beta-barrel protein [Robbsia andropogonis]|uniref:outer membrane beta-barrel protein n=1 Tax=Robbsia andropogonis TaxID=28092 RepID=UPI000464E2A7|nr:outer membrane beta-barrel protein [Robbsia andropogonis]MCP1121145.1 outer membrane beta-barrel protein [Robbsia andropogonis]MCP1130938.1 outer membrane beta-barrel protein [Robbsia andropogonis]